MSTSSRRRYRGVLGLSVAVAVLMATSSSGTAVPAPYPGLPEQELSSIGAGGWVGVVQTGMGEVARAKQSVRVPVSMAAGWNATDIVEHPPPFPGALFNTFVFSNVIYLVSPKGARHNYGELPPFTVRTVAFGTIPVEATVQISQQRGEDGLPTGIEFVTKEDVTTGGPEVLTYFYDSVIDDRLDVAISDLKIDGRKLPLARRCETSRSARLRLVGDGGGALSDLEFDPDTQFRVAAGGTLTGSIDIPAFSGCVTRSGDDISSLLTATVSGTANAMTLRVSGPFCVVVGEDGEVLPPAPGATTPAEANCPDSVVPKELPYPSKSR